MSPAEQIVTTEFPWPLVFVGGRWWLQGRGSRVFSIRSEAVQNGVIQAPALIQLLRAGAFSDAIPPAFGVTIVPTSNCNLACPYCTQNLHGGLDPIRIPGGTMTPATISATVAFVRRRMAEGGRNVAELTLFGGEPLLRPDICGSILQALGEVGLSSACMITNGTRLSVDAVAPLVAQGLTSLQITLDGAQTDHDQLRTTRGDHQGTFDSILQSFAETQRRFPLELHLRINVTRRNQPNLSSLLTMLAAEVDVDTLWIDFGIIEDTGIGFADAPIRSERLVDEVLALFSQASNLGFKVAPLSLRPCSFCDGSPGENGAVVAPDGSLYSCWDAIGRDDLAVGDVWNGYDSRRLENRWKHCGFLDGGSGKTAYEAKLRLGLLRIIAQRAASAERGGHTAAIGDFHPRADQR